MRSFVAGLERIAVRRENTERHARDARHDEAVQCGGASFSSRASDDSFTAQAPPLDPVSHFQVFSLPCS